MEFVTSAILWDSRTIYAKYVNESVDRDPHAESQTSEIGVNRINSQKITKRTKLAVGRQLELRHTR